ncbi:MAG: F420-0--gamma-glutamyl ligase [Candidatus Staskawiczbacteria bacterium]|nr:F420-0--gamma-glutamyl ligase [Candidatus Staskawiczbacteria bacterium]
MENLQAIGPNKNKNLIIEVDGKNFQRFPIKTKLITPQDKDISLIIEDVVKKYVIVGDIIFISEKVVAVTQGRSYPLDQIKTTWLADVLSRFVKKTPIGIGLGSPQTMQLAIEEVGIAKILLASVIGFLGKVIGIKGLFYILAGEKARSIDGAVPYAIPPYNTYVSKGPVKANEISQAIAKKLGVEVAIVDANDIGVNILGASNGIDKKLIARMIIDNPLGQSDEQTPIGIIREMK